MKYDEAKTSLSHALNHQQSISISKLNKLLQSLNIDNEQSVKHNEIEFLKNEIKKMSRTNRRYKRALNFYSSDGVYKWQRGGYRRIDRDKGIKAKRALENKEIW